MEQIYLFDEMEHAAKRKVASRTGTFTDNMKLPLHRWYRYSAGFSAEWAVKVIRDHNTGNGLVVLDPFAGSGTTLLGAEQAGVQGYGFESHHFVYRVARAKLLWHLDTKLISEMADQVLTSAKNKLSTLPENVAPLLTKCYSQEALQRLFALRDSYFELQSADTGWILIWLAITTVIRVCSHAGTAQWQYVLPNKSKSNVKEPFLAFRQKIAEMTADMLFAKNAGYTTDAKVLPLDSRIPYPDLEGSVDLVLTSPPYPNNYDYADATRLEMTFWGEIDGWGDLHKSIRQQIIRSCSQHAAADKLKLDTLLADDVIAPIRSELETVTRELEVLRETKGGKKAYHIMVAAYFNDLGRVFTSLRRLCKTGSDVCYVIGDSAPYGVYVPAERWLGQLAVAAGFKTFTFEKIRDRNLKWKNRKHTVPLHEGRLWIKG